MRFVPLAIDGAWLVEPERNEDERGFFARTWCRDEFARQGLDPGLVQCSISYNRQRGTLRGLHFQRAPHAEAKLVRCTAGAIHDVVVDLRADSPTFRRWVGVTLDATNRHAVYVPAGCAHGFLTRADDTEVYYQMSTPFEPGAADGLRWNDPGFAIEWPEPVRVVSERDAAYPDHPR